MHSRFEGDSGPKFLAASSVVIENAPSRMKHFFISYTKADKDWARWIDWLVRSKGFTTFTQFNDIPWGSNFLAKMREGLNEAERMIAVVSPDFLSSGFTEAEWTPIFKKETETKQTLLFPIKVRESEI